LWKKGLVMARDFFPRRDADVVPWSANFRTRILDPKYTVDPQTAAEYALLDDAFAEAYHASQAPGTRTPVAVQRKDGARRALEDEARRLCHILRATRSVTREMRVELGMGPGRAKKTRIDAPATAPLVTIHGVVQGTVEVRLRDRESFGYRKGNGVAGAAVFTYVGENPPGGRSGWKFERNSTRTRLRITFGPEHRPGAKVWVCACWLNPRGMEGPMSNAAWTNIQRGEARPAQLGRAA
jgi:hypothetical protein